MMKAKMTSRERVKAFFANVEPDRVPRGFSGNPGIGARLKEYFCKRAGKGADYDWGRFDLGCDDRYLGVAYTGPRLHPELPGRRVDPEWGTRTRWIEHESGGYHDFCDFALEDLDPDRLANWPMPSPDNYDYASIPQRCREAEDMAVYVGHPGYGDIMNSTGAFTGMESMLLGLIEGNEALLDFIDRRLGVQLRILGRMIDAAGGRVDFLWLGEDLGTQRGPMIGIDLYRQLLRPRHQKFVDLAKAHGLPVMVHSCGSSSWAFEDFIEMGIAAVDTLQPEAWNMQPTYLKATFGGRLAFHGCISTSEPLTRGTAEEVYDCCRQTLEIMMPGGGYWFSPTHQVQDNTPTENVLAMYRAAEDFGYYQRR